MGQQDLSSRLEVTLREWPGMATSPHRFGRIAAGCRSRMSIPWLGPYANQLTAPRRGKCLLFPLFHTRNQSSWDGLKWAQLEGELP